MFAGSLASPLLHAQGYEADKPMGMAAQQKPDYLAHAGIEQRLGQPLPMAAIFTDETGRTGPAEQLVQQETRGDGRGVLPVRDDVSAGAAWARYWAGANHAQAGQRLPGAGGQHRHNGQAGQRCR